MGARSAGHPSSALLRGMTRYLYRRPKMGSRLGVNPSYRIQYVTAAPLARYFQGPLAGFSIRSCLSNAKSPTWRESRRVGLA